MKLSDSAKITRRITPWTALNQPAGWSTAASPPLSSTRMGWAASAPAIATAVATSNVAKAAQ